MDNRQIKIKYSIIAFILVLIPFTILLGILNSIANKPIYNQTIIIAAFITAILNSSYIYIKLTKLLQNKNQQ